MSCQLPRQNLTRFRESSLEENDTQVIPLRSFRFGNLCIIEQKKLAGDEHFNPIRKFVNVLHKHFPGSIARNAEWSAKDEALKRKALRDAIYATRCCRKGESGKRTSKTVSDKSEHVRLRIIRSCVISSMFGPF